MPCKKAVKNRFRKSPEAVCSVVQHTVADSQLCVDVLGIGGIFLQLAADVGHVHPENLVAAAAAVRAPHVLQNEVIGEWG